MKSTIVPRRIGRVFYGIAIFLIILSTLESALFILDQDFLNETDNPASYQHFHELLILASALCAVYEAITLSGLEGLRRVLSPEHVALPSPFGKYEFRVIKWNELPELHALASELYGAGNYAFTINRLRDWYRKNGDIFFGAFWNNQLVGYMDSFPISRPQFLLLAIGVEETRIEPQAAAEATEESVFYIASVALSPRHAPIVDMFLRKAALFYARSYLAKPWSMVCALAASTNGGILAERLGMVPIGDAHVDIRVMKREHLPKLSPYLSRQWQRFF